MLLWHEESEVLISHEYLFSVKMSGPHRCGWRYIAIIIPLLTAAFLSAPRFVQSITSRSTNFSFPVFLLADDFMTFGKTSYDADNLSFIIDPHYPTSPITSKFNCVKLLYPQRVQMKNSESSAMASFSTSFTFSLTLQEQSVNLRSGWETTISGFAFAIVGETINNLYEKNELNAESGRLKYFLVEFDTYNSYLVEDPSDNHIGVDLNSGKSVYTYNLCGGQNVSCSFPWTGRTYTARIDYNGSTRSFELWFANGSLADENINPSLPALFTLPELDLTDFFDDNMYVGFSANSGPFLDTYEILSWNFESSFSEELVMPESHIFSKRNFFVICAACGSTTIILFFVCLLGCRRQSHSKKSSGLESELLVGLQRFSFKELKKATNHFNESALLGKGGSGSVYKGTLTPSGMAVAVKRFTHDSEHVEREFLAEVSSISQIRHRNLVHLQGWCHEVGHFLLVFDYMSNGSLNEWLFPGRRRYPRDPKYKKFEELPLELRFSILAGIAAAVEYLHEEWIQVVLHRDIKSSNVMLDKDFSPHLGDFGLARLIDHEKQDKTTIMAGTLGYMAPEMHFTGKATKQSDVYSFGILLLEVICGRRPVNLQVEDPNENYLLVQNVWQAREAGNILNAVHPALLNLYSHQLNPASSSTVAYKEINSLLTHSISEVPEIVPELNSSNIFPAVGDVERKLVRLLHLGLQCCLADPGSRPSMRIVKQAILQVMQGSTGEDAMTVLDSMPPLPLTMPVHGSVPQVLQVPSREGTKLAQLENGTSASFLTRSDTMSVLRRRFQSAENEIQLD